MLKAFLFCVFAPCAMLEIFYSHQFGIAVVGGLYLILSIQADMSARKLALYGLRYGSASGPRKRWNEFNGDEEELELRVSPLGEPKRRKASSYQRRAAATPQRERPRPAPAPAPAPEARQAPPPPQEPQQERQAPPPKKAAAPRPLEAHEILGVPREAATRTIVNSFRRWIKRVHPDSGGAEKSVEIANYQARQITNAKQQLLDRRRSKKAA